MVSPLNSNSVESTLEIVVARLGDLKEQQAKDAIALTSSIDGIRNEVRQMSVLYVPRAEWLQRNALVDERTTTVTAKVEDLTQRIETTESRRYVSPTAIAGLVIAAASLTLVLLRLPL